MERPVLLRLVEDPRARLARRRLQDLRDRLAPGLLRHPVQARHSSTHDLVDDVGAHRTGVGATGVATHTIGDEVQPERAVDEEAVLVRHADAADVGGCPRDQTHRPYDTTSASAARIFAAIAGRFLKCVHAVCGAGHAAIA